MISERSDAEIAWLAGVFEGEGSLTKGAQRAGRRRWILIISMTDEDVVRRCFEVGGVGNFYGPYQPQGIRKDGSLCKPFWIWRVCVLEDIIPIATAIRPWLGARRGSAVDELFDYYKTALPKRLRLTWINGRCGRGHPLTDENLYRHPSGKRQCRACLRERRAERRERRKIDVLA